MNVAGKRSSSPLSCRSLRHDLFVAVLVKTKFKKTKTLSLISINTAFNGKSTITPLNPAGNPRPLGRGDSYIGQINKTAIELTSKNTKLSITSIK